jgi:tetratricopeptide (TPR) repeat protein
MYIEKRECLKMFEHEDLMKLSENELWDQLPNVEGELKSDFLYELSRRSFDKCDFKSALALAEQSRDVILSLKDLTSDAELLKTYLVVGLNANKLGDHELVISNLEKALEIAKANNLDKADDYTILVDAYDAIGNREKSIALLEWQFEKYNQIDEDLDCSSCLAQIALHYKGLEQLDKALTKLELALDFAKNSGDTNFTLLIQNYIADTHYDLGNYVEAEKRVEKLITSFELLNNKRSLIEMKYLKYQIMWMTGGNKKELIRSLKALAQEITEQDQESIDQRIFLEKIIISCLEDIGGWENMKEAGKLKKRLADLEELVNVTV